MPAVVAGHGLLGHRHAQVAVDLEDDFRHGNSSSGATAVWRTVQEGGGAPRRRPRTGNARKIAGSCRVDLWATGRRRTGARHRVTPVHRRGQKPDLGTPMPGSMRVGPDADGVTSKSKIPVGRYTVEQ